MSSIFYVFHPTKAVKGCLNSTWALLSSLELTLSFGNNSFHSVSQGVKVLKKLAECLEVPHIVGSTLRGLQGPEDGVLNVEGILRGKSKCGHRGPKIGQIQRKASTTNIKIVMQLIKLKSCKILQG